MFFKNCNPTGYELNFDIKQFLFFLFNFFLSLTLFEVGRGGTHANSEGVSSSRAHGLFLFRKRKKKGKNEDRENCSLSNLRLNKPFPYEEREKKT